jgi:hypothetical protein
MLCDYGCGKPFQFALKNGKHCCSKRPAGCEVLKKINSERTKKVYDSGRRMPMKELYDSLPQETKDRMTWSKGKVLMSTEEVFVNGKEWGSELLRKYLHHYKLKPYHCDICSLTEWNGQHITLELDHIDGVRDNNALNNLRWLCPNCHSQTPTFRGYNKTLTGKAKVSDQELLTAYDKCSNIRQTLIEVGLAPKGGNYERMKKLIARMAE